MAAGSVRVRGLWYAYPDGRQALRGVDLEVAPGERVAVLGPNGAGKTTLMLHLNGILTPQAGEVTVGGLVVDRKVRPADLSTQKKENATLGTKSWLFRLDEKEGALDTSKLEEHFISHRPKKK